MQRKKEVRAVKYKFDDCGQGELFNKKKKKPPTRNINCDKELIDKKVGKNVVELIYVNKN